MAYKLNISPIARMNVRQAVIYYKENVSIKIAQNFIKNYELSLKKIKQNPFFQVYYNNFRGLTLKKFPYIVFVATLEI